MRKSQRRQRPLDALLPRTRQAILAATFMSPERWWYLSDLAKQLERPPSSLQREVAALTNAGILARKREGNRAYFRADPDCAFFAELRGLMAKTAGMADILREAFRPLARRIRVAFVYGCVARSEKRARSDVDLMIVGDLGLADATPLLRRAETRLNRPANGTVCTPGEFARKVKAGHHFFRAVLERDRLFALGDRGNRDLFDRDPDLHA